LPAVVGVVLVLLALFVAGPIGLFIVGALWSALGSWLLTEDAQDAAEAPAGADAA
jgi:hypothetical protein